jgi:hypothetical protein
MLRKFDYNYQQRDRRTDRQIDRQTGNEEGESLIPSDPSLVRLNGTNFYKTNFSLENNQPKQPTQTTKPKRNTEEKLSNEKK